MEALNALLEEFQGKRDQALRLFYLSTPLFFVWDSITGQSVRLYALNDQLGWRILYYTVCFLAGVLCWKKPTISALVGMVESVVNIALLVFSVMLPYYSYIGAVAAGTEDQINYQGFTGVVLVNFLLSACILMFSFYGNSLFKR